MSQRAPHPVEHVLRPLLDPAQEKAELLAQELRRPQLVRRGFRATIAALEAECGPAPVLAAAERLMARIAAERGLADPLR